MLRLNFVVYVVLDILKVFWKEWNTLRKYLHNNCKLKWERFKRLKKVGLFNCLWQFQFVVTRKVKKNRQQIFFWANLFCRIEEKFKANLIKVNKKNTFIFQQQKNIYFHSLLLSLVLFFSFNDKMFYANSTQIKA